MALCLTGAATATECDGYAPEYDGYLVQIDANAPARLMDGRKTAASKAVTPKLKDVYAPAGLYQAKTAADVERLRKSGVLVSAEPNYIINLDDTPDPDDEETELLDASGTSETQWYETPLGADWVRQKGVTGEGVRVGIVDSGIFKEHEDFAGVKILDGANYCVPENDPARNDVSDSVGHGTFVSGLIAAASNGKGIVGLAPGVELVPLKCFESKSGSIADIAAAIYGGVDVWKCQVLNLSLGIEKDSAALRKAIEYAASKGVLMVAAAGNLTGGKHDANGDPLNYPAAYPQVIGVGAVGSNLSAASFSYRNESVEVAAPGQNMRGPSAWDAAKTVSGYGTSYASPIVAAAAALTLSVRPGTTVAEFRDFLKSAVKDLGDEGYDTSYGNGLLQVGKLCAAANPDKMACAVTWKNYDGAVLKVDEHVLPGTLPAYDGADPVRTGYLFAGWDPAPVPVAGDIEYVAQFVPDPDSADIRTPSEYAITEAVPDGDALKVTLTNPDAVTVAASYFDADRRFLNASLQAADADAGAVTLPLSEEAQKARVMLLDPDCRPLCGAFEVELG